MTKVWLSLYRITSWSLFSFLTMVGGVIGTLTLLTLIEDARPGRVGMIFSSKKKK